MSDSFDVMFSDFEDDEVPLVGGSLSDDAVGGGVGDVLSGVPSVIAPVLVGGSVGDGSVGGRDDEVLNPFVDDVGSGGGLSISGGTSAGASGSGGELSLVVDARVGSGGDSVGGGSSVGSSSVGVRFGSWDLAEERLAELEYPPLDRFGYEDLMMSTSADNKFLIDSFGLDQILCDAIDIKASDIHIYTDRPVSFTFLGDMYHTGDRYPFFSSSIADEFVRETVGNVRYQELATKLDLDTSYRIRRGRHKGRRFRLKIGWSFSDPFLVFRTISDSVPSPSVLHIPDEVVSWFDEPKGLVMVNGPTGVGKSTTLSSLINQYIHTKPQKVVTIENPVEFAYVTDGIPGMISQREVGVDCMSFASGLKATLREHPNMILLGEVRDREEIDQLLRAAQTGHLAVSTMHTNSAPSTLNQMKQQFTGSEQARVLTTLAEVAKGFMNQLLVMAPDGKSQWAVHEVLSFDEDIAGLVEAGDVRGLREYQIENKITMEHELYRAAVAGHCTVEEARQKANFKKFFDRVAKGEV